MPGGDQTRPLSSGSKTGRRDGYCAGFGAQGFINPMLPGRSFGGDYRCGEWGWRNRYCIKGVPGWQPPGCAAAIAPRARSSGMTHRLEDQIH